jgi:hypothetical protein
MDFVQQRATVLEDELVVLPKALRDDLREEIEVRLADHLHPGPQIDGLSQSATHVNIPRVEILDHEHGPGKPLQRVEDLSQVAHLLKEIRLQIAHIGRWQDFTI